MSAKKNKDYTARLRKALMLRQISRKEYVKAYTIDSHLMLSPDSRELWKVDGWSDLKVVRVLETGWAPRRKTWSERLGLV